MPAPFEFDQSFAFDVAPAEFWAALRRTRDYPRWWPWLRSFDSDAGSTSGFEPGMRALCVVRGPLPYELKFCVSVLEVVECERIVTSVTGDLHGPARLEMGGDGDGTRARLVWSVELRQPTLRVAARFGRPLMEWGHDWVVERGVSQFRRRALGSPGRDGAGAD